MSIELEGFREIGYEVFGYRHAAAIMKQDFSVEWSDIWNVLQSFYVLKSHVTVGGGGKTKTAQDIDSRFRSLGWREKQFSTQVTVDGVTRNSPTHKVDCVKSRVALELEWSNKDPFYDRDLNNFRLLFELRAISVGIIITKSDSLRPVFERLGLWSKYGTSTTFMNKLTPRIEGGGGGGCPLLVFGITDQRFLED